MDYVRHTLTSVGSPNSRVVVLEVKMISILSFLRGNAAKDPNNDVHTTSLPQTIFCVMFLVLARLPCNLYSRYTDVRKND